MKINRTNVLRVLCMAGFGIFIVCSLIQSFDAYADSYALTEAGRIALCFGSSAFFIYLLNRNGWICKIKSGLR